VFSPTDEMSEVSDLLVGENTNKGIKKAPAINAGAFLF